MVQINLNDVTYSITVSSNGTNKTLIDILKDKIEFRQLLVFWCIITCMIKRIEMSDLDMVMTIIEDAKRLLGKNSLQWQQGYPNTSTMIEDIDKERLYGYYDEDGLLGIIAIVYGFNDNYTDVDGHFAYPTSDKDMVIHRIAVKADAHKQGIGDKLVKFAIEKAKKHGCVSAKIDTHRNNIPMQKISLNNGFAYCGTILLKNGEMDNERLVYELVL